MRRCSILVVTAWLTWTACGCERPPRRGHGENAARPGERSEAARAPGGREVLGHLDADDNGLYDPAERKALLAALAAECPELDANYDADGDGEVTIAEQTAGRHPLSVRVPRRICGRSRKFPWAIDLFPEWIMTAYLQEDVRDGPVGEHVGRGTIPAPATQADAALRPAKAEDGGGVAFDANSGRHLTMPGQRDARWNYRWCLFTFRIDGGSGSARRTVLLDLNKADKGNGSNTSSPRIWYDRRKGLCVQYVGRNAGGRDRRVMATDAVVADGRTWNVVVCGIRYGRMFASVNGRPLATEKPQPDRFSGDWAYDITSYLGETGKGNAAWAYDALVFGLTEPSEAMVRKMTGWAAHRLGFQALLPAGHPYRRARPVLDEEDFPRRYVHDDRAWTRWGESLSKAVTRVNAGGPRVAPEGFQRVFYDDFRADRVTYSGSGAGDLWMAPGFNTAVGADARLIAPGRQPDAYPHDADKRLQTLSLVRNRDRWWGSAFYSVNDLGHGYTWAGPKIVRIRCKLLPSVPQKDLAGGLFPAFWSYNPEYLFWRTANRIEVDWVEFDGQNGRWYNGLSSHVHYCHVKNIFARNPKSYKRYKVYSGELSEEKGGIPGGLYFWDGEFHTWEWVVDRDMTYVNVTVGGEEGQERWVEICRCPTAPTYLQPLDLQLDYALRKRHGVPEDGARQDFVIDWIEVLQKTDALKDVPPPFTARPTLAGEAAVGRTITCRPAVEGVTDLRYYWFADGYPLTWGASETWTVTPAEAGTELRCMVKAVGARDMPEAWSEPVAIPPRPRRP